MNPQQAAVIGGALRAALAAVLGGIFSKYLPVNTWTDILGAVCVAGVCVWSVYAKQGDAQALFPTIMGCVRNIGSALLAYAIGRGWLTSAQAADITAGAAIVFTMLSSAEAKLLSINPDGSAKR